MSAHLVNARVVQHFFYNAPALNALPVHLLRQVFIFVVFWSLFLSPFSVRVFEVLERSLGSLGSILEPFGEHLGVILVNF